MGTATVARLLGVNVGLGSSVLLSRPGLLGFKNAPEFLSSQLLNLKRWEDGLKTGDWTARQQLGGRFVVLHHSEGQAACVSGSTE